MASTAVIVLLLAAGVGALCPERCATQLELACSSTHSSRDGRAPSRARLESEHPARGPARLRARDDGLESARCRRSRCRGPRRRGPRRATGGALVLSLCCAIAALSSLDRVMSGRDAADGRRVRVERRDQGPRRRVVHERVPARASCPRASRPRRSRRRARSRPASSRGRPRGRDAAAASPAAPLLACRALMGAGESCVPVDPGDRRALVPGARSRFFGCLAAAFASARSRRTPCRAPSRAPAAGTFGHGAVGVGLAARGPRSARDDAARPNGACRQLRRRRRRRRPDGGGGGGAPGQGDAAATAWARVAALPWGEIARAPPIRAAVAASMANLLRCCARVAPDVLQLQYGLDTSAASLASAAPFVAAAGGAAAAGLLGDRSPRAASLDDVRKRAAGRRPTRPRRRARRGRRRHPTRARRPYSRAGSPRTPSSRRATRAACRTSSRRSAPLITGVIGGVGSIDRRACGTSRRDPRRQRSCARRALAAVVQLAGTRVCRVVGQRAAPMASTLSDSDA